MRTKIVCLGCGRKSFWNLEPMITPEGYGQQRIIHNNVYDGCGTRMRRFIGVDGEPRPWEINRSPTTTVP